MFFGGKIFTATRVEFSGKNYFLAHSLPENFYLRNEKFWNVGLHTKNVDVLYLCRLAIKKIAWFKGATAK